MTDANGDNEITVEQAPITQADLDGGLLLPFLGAATLTDIQDALDVGLDATITAALDGTTQSIMIWTDSISQATVSAILVEEDLYATSWFPDALDDYMEELDEP